MSTRGPYSSRTQFDESTWWSHEWAALTEENTYELQSIWVIVHLLRLVAP